MFIRLFPAVPLCCQGDRNISSEQSEEMNATAHLIKATAGKDLIPTALPGEEEDESSMECIHEGICVCVCEREDHYLHQLC